MEKEKMSCPCCYQLFDSSAECVRSMLQPCGHVLCHACSEVALDLRMCPFCGKACRAVENLNPTYDLDQLQHDIQNVDLSKEKIDIIDTEFEDQTKVETIVPISTPKVENIAPFLTPINTRPEVGDVILSSMKKTLQQNLSSLTSKIQDLEHKKKQMEIKFMKTIQDLELRHKAEIEALRKEMKETPSTDEVNLMLRKQNENLRQTIESMEKRLSAKMTQEKKYRDAQSEIKELKSKLSTQNKIRNEWTMKLNEKVRQLENNLIALRTHPSPKYEVQPSSPHSVRSADRSVKVSPKTSPSSPPKYLDRSKGVPKYLNRKVSVVQPGGVRREGREWVAHYHTRNGEDHYVGTFETRAEAVYAYRRRQEYYRQKRLLEQEEEKSEDNHTFSPQRTPYSNGKKLLPPPSTQSRLSKKVVANALRNTKRVIEGSSMRDNAVVDFYNEDDDDEYAVEYAVTSTRADIDTPEKVLERLLEEARTCSTSMGGFTVE
eukprot:g1923.t1